MYKGWAIKTSSCTVTFNDLLCLKILLIFSYHWLACQQMNQLSVVLQLALSPVEEKAFTNFLQDCHNPWADDMHVMYYLERSRSVSAGET
jgi:hypothetical protein